MAKKPLGRRYRRRLRSTPLSDRTVEARDICLELQDNSLSWRSAVDFFNLRGTSRDPIPQAARLAEQFELQNRHLLRTMGVQFGRDFDGNDFKLRLTSGSTIGAIPLYSPTSALLDYGLVIQPRFPWNGIGPMLAEMGWRIVPVPLKLPLLKRSERRVPLWVLSFMILSRLKALLDHLTRRFETTSEIRRAPRGRVEWNLYATRHAGSGDFVSVPCTFPDLRDDSQLKGAIRYTLERQLRGLQTQTHHGSFIHRLIDFCQQLLLRVQTAAIFVPSPLTFSRWLERPMRTDFLKDGLQAIQWTVEERGLAGLSELEGIPWHMPMETFFESWVEVVLERVAQSTGARLKVGRKRETTHPISWSPPSAGSQKSLIPDLWLEWESTTLIVDAKYKRHWEELHEHSWAELEEALRERHRNDLLQVLAYANLARTPRVVACLAYACTPQSWTYLREKNRLIHKAEITIGNRSLYLWLTAIPMASSLSQVVEPLQQECRNLLQSPA